MQPVDQTARTPMDVGLPRVRRRSDASYYHVTAQWLLTDSQMSAFDTWWRGSGRGGAVWFNLGLKITGRQGAVCVAIYWAAKSHAKATWSLADVWQTRGARMTDLTTALKEAYASAPTNVIIYHTLELYHPSFTQAIRVVRDFDPLQATLESTAPRDASHSVQV